MRRSRIPTRPARPCISCGELTRATRCPNRCPKCQKQADARRNQIRTWYRDGWGQAAKAQIEREPFCAMCGHRGSKENPLTADHIRPAAHGGTNEPENLRTLCRIHNSRLGGSVRR